MWHEYTVMLCGMIIMLRVIIILLSGMNIMLCGMIILLSRMIMMLRGVPRRLFFATQQRIAITLSPNYYKKCSVSQRERIKKNMAQMSSKFGEIIKKL